jgi:hypothetical protein
LTCHLTRKTAGRILERTLALRTIAGIDRYMERQIARIAPGLKLLDSA